MSSIATVEIGVNRYAPAGSGAINMYVMPDSGMMTIGQLVQAACMFSAAAHEAQSVLKMNKMTNGSVILEQAADWLGKIADGTADWGQAKTFLVDTMGIESTVLPDDISSYDRRMQAANALKNKMDVLTKSQQEEMVDLQTIVNRRDVAHSTASNVVRTLANSTSSNAVNFG